MGTGPGGRQATDIFGCPHLAKLFRIYHRPSSDRPPSASQAPLRRLPRFGGLRFRRGLPTYWYQSSPVHFGLSFFRSATGRARPGNDAKRRPKEGSNLPRRFFPHPKRLGGASPIQNKSESLAGLCRMRTRLRGPAYRTQRKKPVVKHPAFPNFGSASRRPPPPRRRTTPVRGLPAHGTPR